METQSESHANKGLRFREESGGRSRARVRIRTYDAPPWGRIVRAGKPTEPIIRRLHLGFGPHISSYLATYRVSQAAQWAQERSPIIFIDSLSFFSFSCTMDRVTVSAVYLYIDAKRHGGVHVR